MVRNTQAARRLATGLVAHEQSFAVCFCPTQLLPPTFVHTFVGGVNLTGHVLINRSLADGGDDRVANNKGGVSGERTYYSCASVRHPVST